MVWLLVDRQTNRVVSKGSDPEDAIKKFVDVYIDNLLENHYDYIPTSFEIEDIIKKKYILIDGDELKSDVKGKSIKLPVYNVKIDKKKLEKFIKGKILVRLKEAGRLNKEAIKKLGIKGKEVNKIIKESEKIKFVKGTTKKYIKMSANKYIEFQKQIITEGLADAVQNLEDEDIDRGSSIISKLIIIILILIILLLLYQKFVIQGAPLFNI